MALPEIFDELADFNEKDFRKFLKKRDTIKVNGVETVSVCTGDEPDGAIDPEWQPKSDGADIVHVPLIPTEDHDQPETDGTPVWIWSTSTNALLGEHGFEDFRGAKYCHEIRVPVGWSLVSRRCGGTFLRNVFGTEVGALDAIASAMHMMNNPHPFRLVATTEP